MAVISLDINVDDLQSVLALFNKIEVFRSATELGTYAEITATEDLPASLTGTIPGPWNLSSKALTIVLNSADPLTVTFTGTDPLDINSVIQAVNSVIPGFATNSSGCLKLTSPVTGTGSSITLSGNAAAVLGLSTSKVNGLAARITVVSPTTDYNFRDFDGLDTYWYKTRYYSTATGSVSSFSDPRQGNPQVVLPSGVLSKAYVYLSDGAGRPVCNRRIIFVPTSKLSGIVSGDARYGILPGFDRIFAVTDQKGYAECDLARGLSIRVFFEGSSYNRDFVVPNADTFDLLALIGAAPDPFDIVQSPPMPIRSS